MSNSRIFILVEPMSNVFKYVVVRESAKNGFDIVDNGSVKTLVDIEKIRVGLFNAKVKIDAGFRADEILKMCSNCDGWEPVKFNVDMFHYIDYMIQSVNKPKAIRENDTFILNTNDTHEFMTNSDDLLKQGYTLSSSNCGVNNDENYYIGIFVLQSGVS